MPRRHRLVWALAACAGLLSAPPGAVAADPGAEVLLRMATASDAGERRAALERAGVAAESRVLDGRVIVAQAADETSARAAVARLNADPAVAWAERNERVSVTARPDDPLFPGNGGTPSLWGLENPGGAGALLDADIDAAEGWNLLPAAAVTGRPWAADGSTVGVIDSGVFAEHEDLAGKIVTPCYEALNGDGSLASGCADANGHGTHVAGTIAAATNNGLGIAGVAPGARVLMCRALDADGSGWMADVAACVDHLVQRSSELSMRVISMSLGGGPAKTLRAAVEHAAANDLLVVASAGNDGDSTLRYPAAYPSVVSVAATDALDRRAVFSNINDDVELAAPGVAVVSTVPVFEAGDRVSSGYQLFSGTSMAAPHVAAVAALTAHRLPSLDIRQLRETLHAAVDDLGPAGRDDAFGYGRINLRRALAAVTPPEPPANQQPVPAIAPPPAEVSVEIAETPATPAPIEAEPPPAPAEPTPEHPQPPPTGLSPDPGSARVIVPRRQRRAAVGGPGVVVRCTGAVDCSARIRTGAPRPGAWQNVGPAGRIRLPRRLARAIRRRHLNRLVVEIAVRDATGLRVVGRTVRVTPPRGRRARFRGTGSATTL